VTEIGAVTPVSEPIWPGLPLIPADPAKPMPTAVPTLGEPYTTGQKNWFLSERIAVSDASTFSVHGYKKRGAGFHIEGDCPSCKHPSSAVCTQPYLSRFFLRTKNFSRSTHTVLRCACTQNHAGPAGSFGCGSEWLLELDGSKTPELGLVQLTPSAKSRVWAGADVAANVVPNTLSNAQALATKWQTGLAAVVGLVGVSAIAGDSSKLAGFDNSTQAWFGGLAIGAVVLTAISLYLGDLSSIGPLRKRSVIQPTAADADLIPLRQARNAVGALNWSILTTAIAVACTVAATAILLFTGPSTSGTSKIIYKDSSNKQHTTDCGAVTSQSTDPGTYVLTIGTTVQVFDKSVVVGTIDC